MIYETKKRDAFKHICPNRNISAAPTRLHMYGKDITMSREVK